MPVFGINSRKRLSTCHPDLQAVLEDAIQFYDFSVICGYRDEADQNAAFERGASKLKYPYSKHNKVPSMAADCVPFPISWAKNREYRFEEMAKVILASASKLGIKVTWGGDWVDFPDKPHIELKGYK